MLTLINKLKQIIIKDEGSNITTDVSSINFTGAGVTATTSGDDVTVNITGGGAGIIWQPPPVPLLTWFASGPTLALNPNLAGIQRYFAANADESLYIELPLDFLGVSYDGSNLKLRLSWQLFTTTPGATDVVTWRVRYVFVLNGEDADSKVAVSTNNNISVGGRSPNQLYTDDLNVMTGLANAKVIGISLARLGGAGSPDTYTNTADLFGIELIKI